MPNFKPIPIGTVFTRLTAKRPGEPRQQKNGTLLSTTVCNCLCGVEVMVLNKRLRSGGTTSCGCLHRERFTTRTHGHSPRAQGKTRTYRIWAGMKSRCTNPKATDFPRYGGSGITVCDRWLSFENFLADMGECPPNLEIDRYPNQSGNYESGNCRWATRTQQNRNARSNRIFTVMGVTGCLAELCEHFGTNASLVNSRLIRGWPIERAIFEPLHSKAARRTVPP